MQTNHEEFIRQSYAVAEQAEKNGNHPFGALLVKEGIVLLTAENTVNTEQDATRHAELNLVSMACQQFDSATRAQSVLFTSTEPCAMCAGAIYWAGIRAVVFGCSAKSLGEITGGSLVIPCQEIFAKGRKTTQVFGPILEAEGMLIHQRFWK